MNCIQNSLKFNKTPFFLQFSFLYIFLENVHELSKQISILDFSILSKQKRIELEAKNSHFFIFSRQKLLEGSIYQSKVPIKTLVGMPFGQLDWYFWTPPIFLTPIKKIMKNTDLLCEIGLKYERNMGYQNMGGGQKYQSKRT